MSFTHVAAFVWKESADRDELDAKLVEALETYVSTLDGVEAYWCGPDAGVSPGTADFVVVGRFLDQETFVDYRDDERHQAILRDLIAPSLASRCVVQLQD